MDRKIAAVGFSAGLATILMWQLGYWQPAMMEAAPTGLEAAITGVIATLVGWITPNKKPPSAL